MKKYDEEVKICEICGKKLKNWIKCYDKYFCCYQHLDKYEESR